LGTGRCGTRSLAKDLGGIHEQQPWFSVEAIAAYWGDEQARELCRAKLERRLASGVPQVDLHQSYLIPIICSVDPDAEFIWLVRHPMTCIASFVAGGAWSRMNNDSESLWRPRYGWPVGLPRFDKALHYWLNVNVLLERELVASGHPWRLVRTETLVAHKNVYPKSRAFVWKPEEAARVMDETAGLWLRLLALVAAQAGK
jgi:hypothetical protein